MFQHSHHFVGRRWDTGNRHDTVAIDLQHLIRAIVHHHVACSRAAISCHQHAIAILESQNRGGVRERMAGSHLDGTSQRITLFFKQLKEIALHPHFYLTFVRISLHTFGWAPKSGFTARVQRGPSEAARCASTNPDSAPILTPLSVADTAQPVSDPPCACA